MHISQRILSAKMPKYASTDTSFVVAVIGNCSGIRYEAVSEKCSVILHDAGFILL